MEIQSPKTVKSIFIGFIFYLPLQYLLVGIVGGLYSEPWPTFVLPGFKGVYAYHDVVELPKPVFSIVWMNDQVQKTEISPARLFPGLPASQMQGFIRNNFRFAEFDSEVKEWLKQRIAYIYPDSSVKALELKWGISVYNHVGDTLEIVSREDLQTLTIPLVNK